MRAAAPLPVAMSIAKFEISMMARICPMDQLVYGGVFERHPPKLRLDDESPGTWWRFVLKEMDSIYLTDTRSYGPAEKERVPRLPSEYAADQVWIGSSFQARFEAEDAMEHEYVDRVIWGSDYPHFEGTYQLRRRGPNGEPMTWASLRFTYAGLPIDKCRGCSAGTRSTPTTSTTAPSPRSLPASTLPRTTISTPQRWRSVPRLGAPRVPDFRVLALARGEGSLNVPYE